MSDDHRREHLTLPTDLSSVGNARRFVCEFALACAVAPETVDVGMLAVSELVTNALLHGAPPIEVRVAVTPDLVRVEVLDASGQPPRMQPAAGTTSEGGRGLAIVDALTDDWGYVARSAAPGKKVWFQLRRR